VTRVRVQALWIGEQLSLLEQLSLRSFVAHGHAVDLWAYGPVAGVPRGVAVHDARAILPEDAIFHYGPEAGAGEGSVAAFSDVFRYTLLHARGGWWVDTDVVCLRPLDRLPPVCFGWQDDQRINVAVLRLPRGSVLARTLRDRAVAAGRAVAWGVIGPQLMTQVVRELGMTAHALPPSAFYPLHHSEAAAPFAPDPDDALERRLHGAYTVHLWNEMLRRAGVDKDATHPPTSAFERLKRRYGVGASWSARVRAALGGAAGRPG